MSCDPDMCLCSMLVSISLPALIQDSRIVIPGGSTKRDLQGFLDPRDCPRDPESESDSDDSDESVDAGASAEERAQAQRRRMRRMRRRQNRRFDDRPPRRLLPKIMWILRHFFALPSVSRQSIQVSVVLVRIRVGWLAPAFVLTDVAVNTGY